LEEELHNINPDLEVSYTTDVDEALKTSKIIISASGAVEALIKPQNILPGSIICDVARPRDVAALVASERDDVLVIEGGIVKVPGEVNFNFNFGYPPGTAYACMAETMLLTLEERFEDYSLGQEIELEKVAEIIIMAEKHGFKLAGLRSFERALTEEKISEIKKEAEKSQLVTC
ncbi:MAG TPA: shikimate dehydrogenase, partial [Halanaerobiales bacterium]|nr:shikimate dehydrogenase [Halanaerobiales bacterium]